MRASFATLAKRYLSYFYALACLLCAARVMWAVHIFGVDTGRVLFMALLVWMAYGFSRQAPLATKLAGMLCLLVAVFLPIAILNPFAAGDYVAQGIEPPTISQTMYWLLPTELFLLVSAYIFDFRDSAYSQAGSEV